MKHIIFVIFSLFLLNTGVSLFAEESENASDKNASSEAFAIIPELECEESTDIEPRRTKVTFNANVKDCLIYLNGNLQGRTKLTITNLVDGIYLLRVEKQGYEYKENFITVDNGKAKTFFVELVKSEQNAESEKPASEAGENQIQQSSGGISSNEEQTVPAGADAQ